MTSECRLAVQSNCVMSYPVTFGCLPSRHLPSCLMQEMAERFARMAVPMNASKSRHISKVRVWLATMWPGFFQPLSARPINSLATKVFASNSMAKNPIVDRSSMGADELVG